MSDKLGSWGELFGRRYLGVLVVLAGGVALYATNVYLTTSLLPSAIEEIGGARFYAWATTIFLLPSVAAAVLVSRLLAATTHRGAYLLAIGLFTLGCAIASVAPDMGVLLAGRAVQGAGGGLLAGLAYALLRVTLPERLWARGSALISTMWAVGTFLGPVLGGLWAQFGLWRGGFVCLGVLSLIVLAFTPKALGQGRTAAEAERFPVAGLLLVAGSALVVSVAGLFGSPLVSAIGVVLGLVLIAVFVVVDRRGPVGVLPGSTFARGSRLRWLYATIALLAIGSTTEQFVPLFGQHLAGLGALAAGFLGAALAFGWTAGEVPSANAARETRVRRLIVLGPAVLALGLAASAVFAPGGVLVPLVIALLLAGAGIGIAWPHVTSVAMGAVGESEGGKAAAGINTVQLLANAFGAALTGLLVNLAGADIPLAAGLMFGVVAVIGVLGVGTAVAGVRRSRAPEPEPVAP
ncbi:MFS transporter [Sciscionella sediminilitoris]|uniref:MFS transporter n=1 Tax=Sciscionella sediminilitoris TaxID=1445613 RepID=UPI0004DEFF9E|nr:MFS transporter [Sciscionella sp. SE31]